MQTTRRSLLQSSALAIAAPALRFPNAQLPGGWAPKLSESMPDVNPPTLRWLRQIGCKHVIFSGTGNVDRERKGYWNVADILRAKESCDEAGVSLETMMIPIDFYPKAMLGEPGRDEEIEKVCRTIKAAGEVSIPMLEWRFWPDFFWDSRVGYYEIPGRGEASLRAFDYDRIRNAPPFDGIGIVGEEEMWSRFLYFAKPIVKSAEQANLKLSMHPNDPPISKMRGVARIFHHTDGLRRFVREIPSSANGITFCVGTIAEMGVNVLEEIRYFGKLGRINIVHLRAVRGTVPRYKEVFIDEGDVDMFLAMKTYKEVGYEGLIDSDHTPHMEGDTKYGHMGRAFSHGYMRALIHALNS